MRRTLVYITALLALLQIPAFAGSVTLTAEAVGSPTPTTVMWPETLTNGDFLVVGNTHRKLTGNGSDEWTYWTWDFTDDPDYALYDGVTPLVEAKVTMTFYAASQLIGNDKMQIVGLNLFYPPGVTSAPWYQTSTRSFQLLDIYSASDVVTAFKANSGTLPMAYRDDALISYAKLELTFVPLPGSACFALGMLGILGAFHVVRRKRTRVG